MNRRKALALMAATPLVRQATPASAGGMGVVYLLGETPRAIAGQPIRIRFAVLGHDMPDHLWNGFDVEIGLIPRDGGEGFTFPVPGIGSDANHVGIYSTEIIIPRPGAYKWSIRAGWEPTYFPTLVVSDPDAIDPEQLVVTMQMSGGFSPSTVDIPVGSTVCWRNTDANSAHQITWVDLSLDDSAPISTGSEFVYRFDTAGEFDYYCAPHPHMTGRVNVIG